MNRCLPPGWYKPRLSDVAELQLGKMLDKAKNTVGQSMPYLRNVNVRWGAIETSDLYNMRFTPAEAARFSIHDGDVLVCEGGEPGRSAIWRGGPTDIKFQKAIHRIRPKAGVLPEWIALFLRHEALHDGLTGHFTGTTIKHLPAQALAALSPPLPPLAEQRRIVARIEALFARTRRARADLECIAPLSLRYGKSALNVALSGSSCEGILDDGKEQPGGDPDLAGVWPFQTIPSTWNWLSFPLLFDERTSSHRKLQQKRYGSTGCLPVIDQGESPIGGWTDDMSLAYEGPLPALIFGDHTRIVKFTSERFVQGADGVKILTARDTALYPRLGYWLLRGLPLPDKGYSRHSKFLRGSCFPVPPLSQQPGLAATLDAIDERASVLRSSATRALALLDRLEQSILACAFRGELVPQDPAEAAAAVAGDAEPPAPRRRVRALA